MLYCPLWASSSVGTFQKLIVISEKKRTLRLFQSVLGDQELQPRRVLVAAQEMAERDHPHRRARPLRGLHGQTRRRLEDHHAQHGLL